MIFIGSGALLWRAVEYAYRCGVTVDSVCCPPAEKCPSLPRGREIRLLRTTDPNIDLASLLRGAEDGIVVSINNMRILSDAVLSSGATFFNIHAGLIQRYRGIAEVCVFAALCRGEERYGVTLHRILPGQLVDTGPVVSQLEFDVTSQDNFYSAMTGSINACQRIFESSIEEILSGKYVAVNTATAKESYTYASLPDLCRNADPTRLSRASELGGYTRFFPRLTAILESIKGRGE